MKHPLRQFSRAFAAGCAGGAAAGVFLRLAAEAILRTQPLVESTVQASRNWFAAVILFGGLWGFLQMVPFFNHAPLKRGLVLALVPIGAVLAELALLPRTEGFLFPLVIARTKPWTEIAALLVWGQVSTWWFAKAK